SIRKLMRQESYDNQIDALKPLKAIGHDVFYPVKAWAFGRQVAGRTLAVSGTRNNDQAVFALHVSFNGFPHAHHFALWLYTCQRALNHIALFIAHHLVKELGVSKGSALCCEMIPTVGGVGVVVFLWQPHGVQIFTGSTVAHNGVGG